MKIFTLTERVCFSTPTKENVTAAEPKKGRGGARPNSGRKPNINASSAKFEIDLHAKSIGNEEVNSVNARELWEKLGVKRDFSTWIKQRIDKYDFVEGFDYLAKTGELDSTGLQGKIDYFISLDMAKELSMVENNAQGKKARRYFIECEKASRNAIESDPTLEIRKLTELVRETTRLADAIGISDADSQGFMIGVVRTKTGFDLSEFIPKPAIDMSVHAKITDPQTLTFRLLGGRCEKRAIN